MDEAAMDDRAIPAATLILVRDAAGPPEMLMVERAQGMAFAGGALVFPGGRIDPADMGHGAGFDTADAPARIAAIRETIEETAVPAGLAPVPDPDLARKLQAALGGEGDFADALQASGLNLDLDALVPLARWVPKFHAKRRFDTLFFLARAPDGDWQPTVIESECVGAAWVTAAEILERDDRGEAKLIFPTRRTLERLAQHGSYSAMEADARNHAIDPITPWIEEVGGERFVTIPEGIGYPVTRERLDGLWRG